MNGNTQIEYATEFKYPGSQDSLGKMTVVMKSTGGLHVKLK